MAMTITPDGQQVWIPDNIAPIPLQFALPGELAKALPPGMPPPPPPPPPEPSAPIGGSSTMGPRGRNMIGLGPTPGSEIAAPEQASVTGGQLPPSVMEQVQGGMPIRNGADFSVGPLDVPDLKGQTKHNAAMDRQAAQQAAFASTPEGQARAAAAQAQDTSAQQAATARGQGYVEGQEMSAQAGIEDQGLKRADRIREQSAQEMAARQKGLADKQAALDTAVKTEADYKIDDNRRWSNLSTGRKILAGISVALSGLGDAFMNKTGPNLALGIIQGAIHDDVAAQIREREQLGKRIGTAKNSIDNYRQITGDMADAHKLKLAEEYDRVSQQIRASAAQYGSDKAKLRGEQMALAFDQQGAALRSQAAESAFGRDTTRANLENARRQTNISAGHLSLANKQFEYSKTVQERQLQMQAAALDNEAQKLAAAGNAKAAEQVGKLGIPAPPTSTTDKDGNVVMQPGGVLQNPDGSPLLVGTEDEAKELRNKMAVTHRLIADIDEIREIRNRVGGESSLLNSTDRQRLETLSADVLLLKKSGTMGMSSDKDMDNIAKSAGTSDAASWRDQEGRLTTARELAANNLNADLKYKAGYKGPALTFTDPMNKSPQATAEDKSFESAIQGPKLTEAATTMATELNSPTEDGVYAKDFDRAHEFATTGTTLAQRKLVEGYVAKATDPKTSPAQRDASIARLAAGAQKAETPELRAYFADQLQRIVGASAPAPSPEVVQ